MERHRGSMWFIIFILFYSVALIESKALIGIDFGSEYMKIAVLKPGHQAEIALNREAQRKTPTALAFRNGERVIGDAAMSITVKQPNQAFLHVPVLLGRQLNHPIVELYLTRYPHHRLITGSDGTLAFQMNNHHQLSVEQLSAMLLEAAIETAQTLLVDTDSASAGNSSGAAAVDAHVALTTPPFYGQSERRALLRAAEYAGIRSVHLVNSNAAVALNFGASLAPDIRPAAVAKWFTFVDMGATSTVVTVASYRRIESGQSQPLLVRIHKVGYDPSLGAINFIDRLVAKDAKETSESSVAKARSEAGKLYRVLSANNRFGKMTRDQLHSLVTDLLNRLRRPVEMAGANAAKVSTGDILLMGGGSRSPLVQEELLKITGRSKIGRSINTDESAALGAVQHLSTLTGGIRLISSGSQASADTTVLIDSNLFPVVVYSNISGDSKLPHRHLAFSLGDPIPQRKAIVLESLANLPTTTVHLDEFYIDVVYDNLTHLDNFQRQSLGSTLLARYLTVGFSDALRRIHSTMLKSFQITAQFQVDSSGLIFMDKLQLTRADSEPTKRSDETSTVTIHFLPIRYGFPMPSVAQRHIARDVVLKFRQHELDSRAAALSRNNLEAAVIQARTRLLGSSDQSFDDDKILDPKQLPIGSNQTTPIYTLCSSPAERRELLAALVNAERLLSGTAAAASSSDNASRFDSELKKFNAKFAAVSNRANELINRPKEMSRLESGIRSAIGVAKMSSGRKSRLILLEAIQNAEKWFSTTQLVLVRHDVTRDPPISTRQIRARRLALEALVANLDKSKKKRKRARKVPASPKSGKLSDEMEDSDGDILDRSLHTKETPREDEAEIGDEDYGSDQVRHELGNDQRHLPNYDDL